MAAGRLDIDSSKKTAIMKQNMREIAELLAESPPKESKARLRAEALIRDDNTICAYDLLKAECQLLSERVSLIDHCEECPADLLPAVSDIMFAAPRVNIKELTSARKQFRRKYGRAFKLKAMNNEGGILNDRMVSNLSLQPVSKETVNTYMEKICKQYEVAWYPTLELKEHDVIAPTPIPDIPVVTGLQETDQSAYMMQLSRTRNLESLDVLPPPPQCTNGFQKGNHDASSVTSSSSGSGGGGGDDAAGGGLLVVAFPYKASESGNSGLVTAQSMPCNSGTELKSSQVTCF